MPGTPFELPSFLLQGRLEHGIEGPVRFFSWWFKPQGRRIFFPKIWAEVKTHPCALKIAAEALRNDRRIVAAAVGGPSGSTALEYASEELKADTDLVLAAAKTLWRILPGDVRTLTFCQLMGCPN